MKGLFAGLMVAAGLGSGAAWGQLTVTCLPPTLPQLINSPVSVACTASGGTGPYVWSVSQGTLPPSLVQDTGSGSITGTLIDPAGPYSFTVTATDTVAPNGTGSQAFSGTTLDGLTVTCVPPTGPVEVGVSYASSCTAGGGTPPYNWTLGGTAIPPGMAITPTGNPATIALVPSNPLASYQYFATATDSSVPPLQQQSATFSGAIMPAVTITTISPLPAGTVNGPYSFTFVAGAGVAPYTWTATGLPAWLTLSTTGVLTGTPPSASPVTFSVTVTDSVGGKTLGTSFTLPVNAAVAITTTSPLAAATVGKLYSQTFAASGGVSPYTWAATGLPTWLTLTSAGVLSGTPPSAGPVTFNVTATDSLGTATASTPFTLPVNAALTITTTSPLPAATIGKSYSQTFAATGGSGGPFTWLVTGQPSGLTMTSAGVLSGTPAASAVTSTITVTVSDGGHNSTAQPFTLPITLAITSTSPLPSASIGVAYSQTLAAAGGAGGYTWTATGLPAWLTLSTAGVLAGTPPTSAVTASFTATVKDSANVSVPGSFTVPVALKIVTTSPLPGATVNVAYHQTLVAGGGSGGYVWSATGLPSWLTLSAAGVLTGTPPSSAVDTNLTAKVTDSSSAFTTLFFSVPVTLSITTTSPLPAATAGSAYSRTFAALGGSAGYTWSATGLPASLTMSTAGTLTGTPTAFGTINFSVTVKDSAGVTATSSFTLPVNAVPLAISTNSSLASGTIGVTYSQTLAGTGGVTPYAWSVTAGSLPNSLVLNGTSGVISGKPTAAGTFTFTVQLADSASTTPATKQFTIMIAAGLTITTAPALPNATVGVVYSQTLQAVGGTPPYTWSITQGALPTPLLLNSTSGAITGAPASTGVSNFTALVTDSHGVTSTKAFALAVAGALAITTASLPNGTVGVTYSQTISASGGAPPYSWSITAGSSPTGTALNPTSGVLLGNPTSSGTFTFTVQVSDTASNVASKAFTVAITSGVTITTAPTLPLGTVGTAYSQTLAATGGTPPYSWTIASGGLPGGLALSAAGVISGTPTTAATSTVTIQVADSTGAKVSKTFTLNIASTPTITSTSVPLGEINVLYTGSLAATGGAPPYTWSVTSNALPPGLTLSAAGAINGTPTAAGDFNFTVQVTDSNSIRTTKALGMSIAQRVSIGTPAALSGGSVGTSYSQSLRAVAGVPPYTWKLVSGALPGGLTLAVGGVISGSPTTAGNFAFTVSVSDSKGISASQQFTIVTANGLIISSAAALPGAIVGVPYSDTLRAAGGTTPYSWTLTVGALPAGLSLALTGVISGTATAVGTSTFTVQVTDGAQNRTVQQMTIAVELQPSITSTSLPNGVVGQAYSQTLTGTGGTAPYSWSITGGALPAGLSLSPAGAVTGTPSAAGAYPFSVQLSDSIAVTATKQFSITITGGLSISTGATLPPGAIGSAYSQALTAAGGTPPYTWSLTTGTLPVGLTLGATGTISGTPTATSSSTFTLQVKDSKSATASQQFTLVIGTALTISTAAALPGAKSGTAYSQTLAAAGGVPPYQWTITTGALPAGLALAGASGVISGTPTAAGTFNFTAQVVDSLQTTASQAFSLVVASATAPSASFTGLEATATPLEQLNGGLSLTAAYPLDITGEVTLTFQPDAVNAADDPAIQFASGGRSMQFTIAHGTTAGPSFALQTGSVAGTITLNVTWQAGGSTLGVPSGLTQTIRIARAAPVITAVSASATSGGLQVLVTGYSNTREVTQAVVQFTAAAGQTLQTTSVTVALTGAANTWFQSAASDQYGSQFIVTLPFRISSGGASAVGSVSVTLTNSAGTSNSKGDSL